MKPIRVIATQVGFYGQLMDVGKEFDIADEASFAESWMRRVEPVEPETAADKPAEKKK